MPRDLTVDVSFTKPPGMLPLEIIVFWDAEDKTLNISSKEMMALVYAIRAFPDNICNSRVDVFVDSQMMIVA